MTNRYVASDTEANRKIQIRLICYDAGVHVAAPNVKIHRNQANEFSLTNMWADESVFAKHPGEHHYRLMVRLLKDAFYQIGWKFEVTDSNNDHIRFRLTARNYGEEKRIQQEQEAADEKFADDLKLHAALWADSMTGPLGADLWMTVGDYVRYSRAVEQMGYIAFVAMGDILGSIPHPNDKGWYSLILDNGGGLPKLQEPRVSFYTDRVGLRPALGKERVQPTVTRPVYRFHSQLDDFCVVYTSWYFEEDREEKQWPHEQEWCTVYIRPEWRFIKGRERVIKTEVNWGAWGSQDPETTMIFGQTLQMAALMAHELQDLFAK